jgi:hypothetical protein
MAWGWALSCKVLKKKASAQGLMRLLHNNQVGTPLSGDEVFGPPLNPNPRLTFAGHV